VKEIAASGFLQHLFGDTDFLAEPYQAEKPSETDAGAHGTEMLRFSATTS
jgi:hypothetical protein